MIAKMINLTVSMIFMLVSVLAAPMQVQMFQPVPQIPMMVPQQNLQMFLPQLEWIRNPQLQLLNPMFNGYQNQFVMPYSQQFQKNNVNIPPNLEQPVQIILLPNSISDVSLDNQHENDMQEETQDQEHEAEDLDSIIIDAPTNTKSTNTNHKTIPKKTQKAILIFPNGRFSIADIIYAIPWLPFEINVPDTISWAYNGIAGIIAGIGQRLPFRPKPQEAATSTVKPDDQVTTSVKALIQRLQMEKKTMSQPIVVMPVNRQVINTQ